METFRKASTGLLLFFALVAGAQCLAQHDLGYMRDHGPNGVRALDAHTAVVWSARGVAAGLWRVRAENERFQWTQIPLLARDAKDGHAVPIAPEDSSEDMDVEVQGGQPRLLWFDDRSQSYPVSESKDAFPYFLMQAFSVDRGASWVLSGSPFRFNPELDSVDTYVPVDAEHAWLLADGQAGAGQLPQALFTTSDSGRSWRKVTDWGKGVMPIGHNSAQLFHVIDAKRAWFVGTCENCSDPGVLNVANTRDGGRTWHGSKPLNSSPGCKDCSAESLTQDTAQPNCFNAGIIRRGPVDSGEVHFCTQDGGSTWRGPIAGPTVAASGPDTDLISSVGCCRRVFTYAGWNSPLGIANPCRDRRSDAQHKTSWRQCDLLETQDGGRSWRKMMPQISAVSDGASVVDIRESGDGAWLLLSLSEQQHELFYSSDAGTHWNAVTMPSQSSQSTH